MEKIPCFLCGKSILLTKTKQGFLSFYCHSCRFRGFLNSDSALEAIQAYILDDAAPEAEPKEVQPKEARSSAHDGEHSSIIQEVKKLRDEIRALKEERTSSFASSQGGADSEVMANWFSGGA